MNTLLDKKIEIARLSAIYISFYTEYCESLYCYYILRNKNTETLNKIFLSNINRKMVLIQIDILESQPVLYIN